MLTLYMGQAVFVPSPKAPVFFTSQILDLAPRQSIFTKRIPYALSHAIDQPPPHMGKSVCVKLLDFEAWFTDCGAVGFFH